MNSSAREMLPGDFRGTIGFRCVHSRHRPSGVRALQQPAAHADELPMVGAATQHRAPSPAGGATPMSDSYIDPRESQIYGALAREQFDAVVLGLVPGLDAAV